MSNILEAGSFVDSPKFVAAVAHDLKEPVRAIFYYSDLLMQKIENGGGEAAKPVLENIIKAAERMRLLIDNSLKFSLADGFGEERSIVNTGEGCGSRGPILKPSSLKRTQPLPANRFPSLRQISED